jgi:hypothetical protein
VKTRVFLAMKNGVHLLQKEHDVIQPFIAENKTKRKLKTKVKMLQEKHIVHEAIKIQCVER